LGSDLRADTHARTFTNDDPSFIIRNGSIIFQTLVSKHSDAARSKTGGLSGDGRQPVAVTSGTSKRLSQAAICDRALPALSGSRCCHILFHLL
jgi:hypothetical protein